MVTVEIFRYRNAARDDSPVNFSSRCYRPRVRGGVGAPNAEEYRGRLSTWRGQKGIQEVWFNAYAARTKTVAEIGLTHWNPRVGGDEPVGDDPGDTGMRAQWLGHQIRAGVA